MPTKTRISVLDAFNTIFTNCYLERQSYLSHTSVELLFLMNMYQLTPAAIVVLSFLLKYYPSEISGSKLMSIIETFCESPKEVLLAMTDRGFLVKRGLSSRGKYGYSISESALNAFLSDRAFSGNLSVNCYHDLLTSSLTTISTDKWLKRFTSSLSLPSNHQFKTACEKLNILRLSNAVQKAFWMLAHWFILYFTKPFDGKDEAGIDVTAELQILSKTGVAVNVIPESERLSKVGIKETEDTGGKGFLLSVTAVRQLFNGHDEIANYDELSTYASIIRSTEIEKKELFFSSKAQEEMNHLRDVLSEAGFKRAIQVLEKQKRNCAIISLLWGPPGTGKTESVKQLAVESGRDIALFDITKAMNCYVGVSEKNYHAIFRAYSYIAAVSSKAPIFLLNEADSILEKRQTNLSDSTTAFSNSLTNILLQEFEDLNGILLATTNLIDNIDPAFGRRFLFKTELTKPDAPARAKIWRNSIPELTEEDAFKLAQFELSGAQISNVVTKRDLAEIYYTGDRGFAFINKLCEEELETETGATVHRTRIGF